MEPIYRKTNITYRKRVTKLTEINITPHQNPQWEKATSINDRVDYVFRFSNELSLHLNVLERTGEKYLAFVVLHDETKDQHVFKTAHELFQEKLVPASTDLEEIKINAIKTISQMLNQIGTIATTTSEILDDMIPNPTRDMIYKLPAEYLCLRHSVSRNMMEKVRLQPGCASQELPR